MSLVATGVKMEAWSVEDKGQSICFNVFCYNIQPGITIDHSTDAFRLNWCINRLKKNFSFHFCSHIKMLNRAVLVHKF
ncbi:MAG: hypothetical protein E7254_03495 [Lachnospiraceae bacterium]|nr:hypothetical protein [Lachnospiraceae bacterium]